MPADAIGLDIGGANLKAATASGRARSRPFALWKHPGRLAEELTALVNDLGPSGPVAVTMTGELCDCFETKREGVRHILAAVADAFPAASPEVWSTDGRFLPIEQAVAQPLSVAAANWHALATLAGRLAPIGFTLLIDIGSTTADIIPILNGRPIPAGRTDPDRLRTEELVYTGVRRTAVCAILGPSVVAELFATTHDVYVRLGMLPEEPENRDTADGRPATERHAHARLARMLGGDPEITPEAESWAVAGRVYERQKEMITHAISAVCGGQPQGLETIVVSGSGEFLARAALESSPATHGLQKVISLSERLAPRLSQAACAYAVAMLAMEALA